MSLDTARRVASRLLKCGASRVKILDAKKAEEALTSEDILSLVKQGLIFKVPVKGVGRGKAKFKQARVGAGRRRGRGSQKGSKHSLMPRKERWTAKVRSQRLLLKKARPLLVEGSYARVYRMVKGNNFRNKKHLKSFLEENKMLKNKVK